MLLVNHRKLASFARIRRAFALQPRLAGSLYQAFLPAWLQGQDAHGFSPTVLNLVRLCLF